MSSALPAGSWTEFSNFLISTRLQFCRSGGGSVADVLPGEAHL